MNPSPSADTDFALDFLRAFRLFNQSSQYVNIASGFQSRNLEQKFVGKMAWTFCQSPAIVTYCNIFSIASGFQSRNLEQKFVGKSRGFFLAYIFNI